MRAGYRPRPTRRRGVRCSRWRFYHLVQRACRELPPRIQRQLVNVAVTVEDVPSSELLMPGDDPLGLYQGTPIQERGTGYTMVLPDKITVYRLPLLSTCHTQRELRDEVRLTVLHEVGHYFGLDDDEIPF